jgi:hypothetical protein
MTVDEGIEMFVAHFENEIKMVSACDFQHRNGDDRNDVHKRLLLCCLIDAMSDVIRIRLPPEKARQENRLKFLAAIRRFGKWRDSQKISRPYLERLLTRVKNDPQFDPVHEYLKDLPLLPNDSIVSTSHDLDPKWFEKNWPRNSKGPVPIRLT